VRLLDHVSIAVRDLGRARLFYDAIFSALQVMKVYERDDAIGYGERNRETDDGHSYLSVYQYRVRGWAKALVFPRALRRGGEGVPFSRRRRRGRGCGRARAAAGLSRRLLRGFPHRSGGQSRGSGVAPRRRSMNADELRALQAPLKERYRKEPGRAVITLRAEGRIGEGIACRVDTGKALVEAGLHPATGGSGMQACSGDMLLEALVACAGVTLKAVATALGMTLKNASVHAEGDLDFRGTLGVAKDAPVGFREIRLRFDFDSDAPQEQKRKLIELTERYCVVLQTIRQAPPVKVAL
jgi:uncharacterized OsmC-like protein/catechol 2,3-dioxygenase-like lactoylglutathione lyase family enzyme